MTQEGGALRPGEVGRLGGATTEGRKPTAGPTPKASSCEERCVPRAGQCHAPLRSMVGCPSFPEGLHTLTRSHARTRGHTSAGQTQLGSPSRRAAQELEGVSAGPTVLRPRFRGPVLTPVETERVVSPSPACVLLWAPTPACPGGPPLHSALGRQGVHLAVSGA